MAESRQAQSSTTSTARDPDAIDFPRALATLRRRAPVVVLCGVLIALGAFLFSKSQTKEYTATSALVFSSNPLTEQVLGLSPASSSSQFAQQASNVELVSLGDLAAKTGQRLGLSEEEVRERISVAGVGESNLVSVSAKATSAALAARIANVYSRQFILEQKRQKRSYFRSALAHVEKQIRALPPGERFGEAGVALQDRAQTLRLLEETGYGEVELAGRAFPPTSPSSPKTAKNTVIGFILGLLAGIGIAFLLDRLERERRLRRSEEMAACFQLPVLATIPDSPLLSAGVGPGLPLELAEPFQLLHARIRAFNSQRIPKVLMVTGVAEGEGVTTVGCHLAAAAVRMGARVLFVEANIRNPTAAATLALPPVGSGMVELLNGEALWGEAVRPIGLGEGSEAALDVLAATGHVPGNPARLIGRAAMEKVLEEGRNRYELVVVDAPPLTEFPDGFSLLPWIDGVLVVGRLGRMRRDRAAEFEEALSRSGIAVLGVVANFDGGRSRRFRSAATASRPSGWTPSAPESVNGSEPSDTTASRLQV